MPSTQTNDVVISRLPRRGSKEKTWRMKNMNKKPLPKGFKQKEVIIFDKSQLQIPETMLCNHCQGYHPFKCNYCNGTGRKPTTGSGVRIKKNDAGGLDIAIADKVLIKDYVEAKNRRGHHILRRTGPTEITIYVREVPPPSTTERTCVYILKYHREQRNHHEEKIRAFRQMLKELQRERLKQR